MTEAQNDIQGWVLCANEALKMIKRRHSTPGIDRAYMRRYVNYYREKMPAEPRKYFSANKSLKEKILWKVIEAGSIEPDELAEALGVELHDMMELVFEILRAGQLRRAD